MVCKGVYWNPVDRAKRWFTPPPEGSKELLFRVRYVVAASDLVMERPSETVKLPNRKDKQQIKDMGGRRVLVDSHDSILAELARRAMIDFVEREEEEDSDSEEERDPNDDEEGRHDDQ